MHIVSVVLPAKNSQAFIAETLESIRIQTYPFLEIIVVDNCSTDGTIGIVSKLMKRDARIKLIRNESPLNMSENFSKAISLATGDFIKLVCTDDLIVPSCIASQVEVLLNFKNVKLCSGNKSIINSRSETLISRRGYASKSMVSVGRLAILKSLRKGTNTLEGTFASLARTKDAQKILPLNPKFEFLLDFDYCFKLLLEGDFYCLEEVVGSYRIHKNSISKNLFWGQISQFNKYIDENIKSDFPLTKLGVIYIKFMIFVQCILRVLFNRIFTFK